MEKKNILKPSFFDAARDLADLCELIDSSDGDIDKTLLEKFDTASRSLEESIDRRKYVFRESEAKIELAKQYKRDLDETIKRLKKVQEKIEFNTKSMIESTPNIPFKDSLGNRLSVQNNSRALLHIVFDLGQKTVSNIISQSDIETYEIPSDLLKEVSYLTLDTEKLRTDLKQSPWLFTKKWAYLEQRTHVRGLK